MGWMKPMEHEEKESGNWERDECGARAAKSEDSRSEVEVLPEA